MKPNDSSAPESISASSQSAPDVVFEKPEYLSQISDAQSSGFAFPPAGTAGEAPSEHSEEELLREQELLNEEADELVQMAVAYWQRSADQVHRPSDADVPISEVNAAASSASAVRKEPMETRIMSEAERLFLSQGFQRTTIAQIATAAGCNSALVHYYFRTKENLFLQIFEEKFGAMFDKIFQVAAPKETFEQALNRIIDVHFTFLEKNASLARFFVTEFIAGSTMVRETIAARLRRHADTMIGSLVPKWRDAGRDGRIALVSLSEILFTIISLDLACVVFGPFYTRVWDMNPEMCAHFIHGRKREIKTLIRKRLLREPGPLAPAAPSMRGRCNHDTSAGSPE